MVQQDNAIGGAQVHRSGAIAALRSRHRLLLVGRRVRRRLRLYAGELKAEITAPVEESVTLSLIVDFTTEHGFGRAGL